MMPLPCLTMWKQESTMSINTDQPFGIPDAAALEKLANEFFRALPGAFPAQGFTPQQANLPQDQDALKIDDPLSGLPGTPFALGNPALPSVGGAGISPSAINP